jgi:hypothetical protein
VIFQMTAHDFSPLSFFSKREGLSAVKTVHQLRRPSFVLPLSPTLRREVAAVRAAYFLAWRRRGKR